jgi:hypothetical protein
VSDSRKCVFCDGPASSREHVIPKWVGEELPKKPKAKWRHVQRERAWATDHVDFKVKRVCRECNHGWMNDEIENPARPVLTRMIHGEAVKLTRPLQERVATWAVKTHAMAQFLHEDRRPITEELRQSLYEDKIAPPQSQVWLSAYAGHATHGAWAMTHNLQLAPGQNVSPDEILDAEMMTLCIGHLVLQSFKWSSAEPQQFQIGLPDELRRFLVPIWPQESKKAKWPGTWTLDNAATLATFAQTWTNTGPPPS